MDTALVRRVGALPLRFRTQTRRSPFLTYLLVAAVLVTGLALLPLAFIGWMMIETGWSAAVPLIYRARVAELLLNTGLLLTLTLPICAALSITLAWLVERSDLPGARVVSWLAVAPLAIPAFVHSYAWISVLPGLKGVGAGVLVSVLAYFPFLYLPIAASFRRLDPGLEDTAASLGLSRSRIFLRVVFPQLRLALCGGGLLIGLHLLAEYGLFVMIRFDTFTTAIIDQFQATYSGSAAIMLAVVLIGCCVALLGLEAWIRGMSRYARIGTGAARRPPQVRLGVWTVPCLGLVIAILVLALGVPLVTLIRWLVKGGINVWRADEIWSALGQTFGLAVLGSLAATIAAFPIAWLAVRAPGRRTRLLEGCNYFVGSLPGVIVALALVSITVRVARPLYQTLATVLIAYIIMFLPLALVSLRVSIAQIPKGLEEAAGSLGRSPFRTMIEITLRLAAPGVASAIALTTLGIANELTATLMLAPNGTRTLATQFWAYSSEIDYAAAAPYALLMILLSLPMTVLLHVQSKWAVGQ